MAVSVRFPDGTRRDVPGRLRELPMSAGHRGAPFFEQVPLGCDPLWRYVCVAGVWLARPRTQKIAPLILPVPDWWQAIAPMTDDSGPSQSSAAA